MRKTLLLIAAVAISQTAFADVPKTMDGRLVDSEGYTLYTFDKDTTPGQSACSGACSKKWPAAQPAAGDKPTGDWTIIKNADGVPQWVYKGHPLYRFADDKKPGDTAGDNFRDVWHIAKP
jgi:predicted lipoprotein with Yx(FWY)xxD motif